MFSTNHFIWLFISIALIIVSSVLIRKFKPSFKLLFTIACILCIISEVVKTFSVIEFDYIGDEIVPFIRNSHLPLHLCSIQIIFIFIVRFMDQKSKSRDLLLGFMFPTFIIGASLALLMPSIFSNSVPVEKAFIHPQAYQFFLYHSLLIILGIYIMSSKDFNIQPKHYLTTMMLLLLLSFASLYLNSALGFATYDIDKNTFDLMYTPNFLFTVLSPIPNLKFTKEWHWYLYLIIIVLIAFITIALFYIPIFIKNKNNKKNEAN